VRLLEDGKRRAAFGRDLVEAGAPRAARGGEPEPGAVGRPALQGVEAVVVGQAPDGARGQIQAVEVPVPRAARGEGETTAVRGEARSIVVAAVRYEEVSRGPTDRLTPGPRDAPDVSRVDERDLLAVRRAVRRAEIGLRGGLFPSFPGACERH